MELTWQQIYERLQRDRNDASAWAALERRVGVWAAGTFWQCGQDTIHDLVADTCSTVLLDFERARGPSTFAGFVLGVALTTRRRLLRVQHATCLSLDGLGLDVAQPEPDESPDVEQLTRLKDAIELLSIRERCAIQLRYLDDLAISDIGHALGVSNGNARRILFNARQHLRKLLQVQAKSDGAAVGAPARHS
jgi:RNA polymerase sigma factor (sigma-70 family)